jgi:2-polyprenyl-3-methyl-5-hydroxy-6-metoxy-1,4-benzoquinol methylase
MGRATILAKDLTPPRLYRFTRRMRRRYFSPKKLLKSEATAEYYDESFEKRTHWRSHYTGSPWYYVWTVIVDRLQAIDSPVVLEIGCGPGQLAAFARDRGITDYVGLDFSATRIEWARSSVPELRFEIADAYTTDLLESLGYNTVLCTEFLEHVDGDLDVMRRVRPGTRFIGTVPNFGGGSHVRFFENAEQVSARYGPCFEQMRVDTFLMPKPGRMQFLIDGIIA